VGQAEVDVAKRAVELLRNVQANVIGCVLNKIPVGDRSYSYYNYYYYSSYYGEYGSKNRRREKKKRQLALKEQRKKEA
jgi:Mrp family chromosome partitioning ATPase